MYWCNHCKEKSVYLRKYTTKGGEKRKVEYCINGGCGYKKDVTAQGQRFGPNIVFGKVRIGGNNVGKVV